MRLNGHRILIVVIFLLTLGLRLFFSFQAGNFTGDESYYSIRQIESITEDGVPIVDDELSYGGREHAISPFFYYLMAFFNLFMPVTLVGKLIPNIIANTVVFLSYLIVLELTKNRKVAIFTAITSGFIPIYFTETVNTVSPSSLFFPLLLAIIYCFMNMTKDRKYANYFIILFLVLAVTHAASYLVVLGFLVYALLIKLEKLKGTPEEFEVILFSTLLILWTQVLIFKQAFLVHGPSVIFQNIPSMIVSQYFNQFSLIEAINKIGIIPLLFGIYVIYKYSFREKIRGIYILLSFFIVIAPLLWLRLIPLTFGMIFIGLLLNLLFGQYLKIFLVYMQKTKFQHLENVIIGAFILVFLVTSLVPTVYYAREVQADALSQEQIDAYSYLKKEADNDSVVLASYKEGHSLVYYTGLQNVIDSNYMLVEDASQRFNEVRQIYRTDINTEAISLLNKYSVDYIIFSETTKQAYGADSFIASGDSQCYELVFENQEVQVFKPMCRLERK